MTDLILTHRHFGKGWFSLFPRASAPKTYVSFGRAIDVARVEKLDRYVNVRGSERRRSLPDSEEGTRVLVEKR